MWFRYELFKLIMFIIGLIWCVAIFQRRHEDLETLKQSKDNIEKSVVLGFWCVTMIIVAMMLKYCSTLLQYLSSF